MRHILAFATAALLSCTAWAQESPPPNPQVVLETSKGAITFELYPDKAPKTVANFLAYVESGFFEGTIFHRVISGFMIQGGGYTKEMGEKETRPAIPNEADNGLRNDRGTLAMARTNAPHSATAQFYVNTVDNGSLNHRAKNAAGWGYAVFGKVTAGMETVDAIAAVRTNARDMPLEPIVITKASVKKAD